METLETLSHRNFFTCKKDKLHSSPYCLFCYIYILMNRREIYFLCENIEDYICLDYPKNEQCKHCNRLKKYNLLFDEIRKKKVIISNETNHSLKLFNLVNRCADHLLKYKKYYVLTELKNKFCDLNH